jgi:hypothetical protein
MKLKATYETDVYVCKSGFLAINQKDNLGEEYTLILSPEQAELVIKEMRSLLKNKSQWWSIIGGEDA